MKNLIKKLSPEMQILIWAINSEDALNKHIINLFAGQSAINPDKLLGLSLKFGLIHPLYEKIKAKHTGKLTDRLLPALKKSIVLNTGNNIKKLNTLLNILSQLEQQGYSPVIFKGPVLAELLDNDPYKRFFADLDIMVLHNEFRSIFLWLINQGFKPAFSIKDKIIDYLSKSRRDVTLFKGDIRLDIHQQIAKGPGFFSFNKKIWQDSFLLELEQEKVRSFSVEDTLVFLSINSAKDGFCSLKHYYDLNRLLSSYPDLNWETIFSRAEQMKSFRIVLLAIALTCIICGLKMPEKVAGKMADNRSAARLLKKVKNKIFSSQFDSPVLTWYFMIPRCLDTIPSRLKFYAWFMFKPSPGINPLLFKLPSLFYFSFYFLNPFILFFKYSSLFVKKVFRI